MIIFPASWNKSFQKCHGVEGFFCYWPNTPVDEKRNSIKKFDVAGRIEWDEKHDGRFPLIIIDGKVYSWEELGEMKDEPSIAKKLSCNLPGLPPELIAD